MQKSPMASNWWSKKFLTGRDCSTSANIPSAIKLLAWAVPEVSIPSTPFEDVCVCVCLFFKIPGSFEEHDKATTTAHFRWSIVPYSPHFVVWPEFCLRQGEIILSEFKAVMLASLRSLVPKDRKLKWRVVPESWERLVKMPTLAWYYIQGAHVGEIFLPLPWQQNQGIKHETLNNLRAPCCHLFFLHAFLICHIRSTHVWFPGTTRWWYLQQYKFAKYCKILFHYSWY